MYVFAFTHTHKDINYAASGGELTPKEIRQKAMDSKSYGSKILERKQLVIKLLQ